MNIKYKIALFILITLGLLISAVLYLQGTDIPVLQPKGMIAHKERNLIITSTLLMLVVVIPVFILTFVITWKYRASNTKAEYAPDWDYNLLAESIWWGFPCVIIIVLAVMTWKSSHDLDPFVPLNTGVKPVKIQVVALPWKWLFIYPEQNIASVNFFQFPEQTPINFEITADAPMNSFWIPQLSGQIFAMPGMTTKLHIIADVPGNYFGSSANLSGKGFAGMTFTAKASSQDEFYQWVESAKQSSKHLSLDEYRKLAEPSEYNPIAYYSLKAEGLFNWIVMKYMMPMPQLQGLSSTNMDNCCLNNDEAACSN
jgi:cytochrome o ubiquinol oxidase subunit II